MNILEQLCEEASNYVWSGKEFMESQLKNPEWDQAGKCHDWRNYVPEVAVTLWNDLSEESRWLVYIMANEQANAEEWD